MFALDGFGTGHSSLIPLMRLPFHYMKVAPCFLDPGDPIISSTLRAMGELSKGLKLRFVVTGVDSEPHLSAALASGAELVQGFYIGKPSHTPQNTPSSLSMLNRVRD